MGALKLGLERGLHGLFSEQNLLREVRILGSGNLSQEASAGNPQPGIQPGVVSQEETSASGSQPGGSPREFQQLVHSQM